MRLYISHLSTNLHACVYNSGVNILWRVYSYCCWRYSICTCVRRIHHSYTYIFFGFSNLFSFFSVIARLNSVFLAIPRQVFFDIEEFLHNIVVKYVPVPRFLHNLKEYQYIYFQLFFYYKIYAWHYRRNRWKSKIYMYLYFQNLFRL